MKKTFNESVIKSLDILDVLRETEQELTLSEISEKTEISISTTYRILSTLESRKYLTKIKYSNQDIRYFLGLKFLSLGQVASEHLDLRIIALPHMKALRNDINEVVHLTVLDGNQAVYIEKVESTRNLRLYTAIG
ncbi:MAG TPA: IclR family transcriptional regulator, partial [Virgibacillus sp.]